ncbi:MAG: radical SAM protein [Desulfobulbus sp.]|jgi:radical SAM protein with 4Fe4S-binding SPASM domain|uniref:radical SAM/SPASM domain-containing protein n=1 Tax=Desulfobulbus sp. TaxID=895 RepID=UPI00284DEB4B|nr:radical SAM protein [Desulfobulbus sp.]MDR2548898.1 radical SAM protein [Desulfobulbus sp.]
MQLYNLEFTADEIRAAAAADRLLSLEIEFSRQCNFRCAYCYVEERTAAAGELSRQEIKEVILQARELGARKIVILGGEPSIYPHLVEMLRFLGGLGLEIELFTNGTGVTDRLAGVLAEERVRVVVKMNSRDAAVQDRLAGKKGAFGIIDRALKRLRRSGYPSQELFLAASTVICRQNLAELVELWQWLRSQRIEPYFEILTPQANALRNTWLDVGAAELHDLFAQLAVLDRERFGREWEPQPPLAGNRCMRHQVSCLVTAQGEVMPCVGVTIGLGNIRHGRLADILKHSQVVKNLKNYRETIKGPCGTCEKSEECYGCRGAAYQMTGDYLASDPTCWRNAEPNGRACAL